MTVRNIHNYLERLNNLIRSESRNLGAKYGLQPVQLDALAYLAICNRYSDTPRGVTDYLGLTKGTVSQTLNALENKGLLKKLADKQDKRVVHLWVTAAGHRLLKKSVPAPVISEAHAALAAEQRKQLETGLKALLSTIQYTNSMKTFGVCKTCQHNQVISENESYCQLTQEALSTEDIELICREHAV